ncbi:MAG: hypothetical protein JRH16_12995 [Deltaproteobacteria bacterium]|nr:hypothetical protein [Deltaproteobacteria bacterium]MBW2360097.1 hypothetical protein [Deltaproteobacteria bacterium]
MAQLNGGHRNLIQGAWLVRVLAGSRSRHECRDCGGRMFVKVGSGRCPMCFTQAQRRCLEIDEIVAEESSSAFEDWTLLA